MLHSDIYSIYSSIYIVLYSVILVHRWSRVGGCSVLYGAIYSIYFSKYIVLYSVILLHSQSRVVGCFVLYGAAGAATVFVIAFHRLPCLLIQIRVAPL